MPSSSLFRKTAHWFERAKAFLLDNLPCCQGCSHCCIGLFPVTLLDWQEIQRGLASCPANDRKRMEGIAREQVNQLRVAAPRLITNQFVDQWSDEEMDRVIERFNSLPCPALESDGRCSVYEFRPLVCRSMGIPPDDGLRVTGACAVQNAVPLLRLSKSLREEENVFAEMEARQLDRLRMSLRSQGEELLLPYAFLSEFRGSDRDTI
ncbi:MAG: YkgJ family cysteine cluster protein [Nitrospira sp.]|nr:YkgJ family cysteine cluster protein [Nitrospira sp.]